MFADVTLYQRLADIVLYLGCRVSAIANQRLPGYAELLVIGVLGQDPFGSYLDDTVRGERVDNRQLLVQRHRNPAEIKNCHVLFISRSEAAHLNEIVSVLRYRNLLIVTDAGGGDGQVSRKQMDACPIDMHELAGDVFRQLRPALGEQKIQFNLAPLPGTTGDPALLRQVFVNLLSNAAKYSRPRAEVVIDVNGRRENGNCIYSVRDNGVGFDMTYAAKLFGVFQRLHSVEEFEGTGVGLAIVQRIVHRHGGRVWAHGKVNEGATFFFSLPKEKKRDGRFATVE